MQIVLSGNRVIAYGDDCFLSMGGTVICNDTGKAYSNATIAEVEAIPADIGSVGYEYHAGVFIPCAPYGKTKGGYIMAACYECSTPRTTDITLEALRDRLDTYATIAVTYPLGSECTCEKDGIILTAIDTNGANAFNVPEAGEWVVKISYGEDTAERTVEITKRWQYETLDIAYFSAYIEVTYPASSTCTCSDGTTTFTDTNNTDAEKTVTFTVPNKGKWTVTSTANDGSEDSASETVEITAEGQSVSVELVYGVFLYRAGNEYEEDTGGWVAIGKKSSSSSGVPAGEPTVTRNADNIYLENGTTAGVFVCGNSGDKIDLRNVSKIVFDGTIVSNATSTDNYTFATLSIWTALGTYHSSNQVAEKDCGTSGGTTEGLELDVSNYNDEAGYVVGLTLFKSGTIEMRAVELVE